MFTLTPPGFRKARSRNPRSIGAVNRRKTPSGVIWSLHRVITNPEATTSEVIAAKRLLLRALHEPFSSAGERTLEAKAVPSFGSAKVRSAVPGRMRTRAGVRGSDLDSANPTLAEGLAS